MDSSRWWNLGGASSVRSALLVGFAIVFGLWMLWGYQMLSSLQQIEQSVSRVHDSYLRGQRPSAGWRTLAVFGRISTQAGSPRVMQFGVKYGF